MPTLVHSLSAVSRTQKNVNISLGSRSYDVLIGDELLAETGRLIATRIGKVRSIIVTDTNVANKYLDFLQAAIKSDSYLLGNIVLPPGEATKNFLKLEELSLKLLDLGIERGDVVVALGGGVIGDLAGFAAGIVRRGVRLIQIPTSFLAQVDSSVGGKTGINTRHGKNLIGVFNQPSFVIIDTKTLDTLPERQMRAGYAEVIKYGLIQSLDFFVWLEKNWKEIFNRSKCELNNAIEMSIKTKGDIVARDELEKGDRALLNLGHTFGHALEAIAGYSERLLHGEAVSIGMAMAFRFSEELGLCPKGTARRVAEHISLVGLPTELNQIPNCIVNTEKILQLMAQDKKVKNGKIILILAHDIGRAFVAHDVDQDRVYKFLEQEQVRKTHGYGL